MKLLVVYFMTTIFFSNTSLNGPTFFTRYTNDLASLGHYAWAHAIHTWFMIDVPMIVVHIQLQCKGNHTTIGYLKGCAIAIIIWFYEVTGIMKKQRPKRTPRIMSYWGTSLVKVASIGPMLKLHKEKEVSFIVYLYAMFAKFV